MLIDERGTVIVFRKVNEFFQNRQIAERKLQTNKTTFEELKTKCKQNIGKSR